MALRFESSGEKKRAPSKKKRSRGLSFYAAVLLCVGAVALTVAVNRSDSGADTADRVSSGQSSSLPFDHIPAIDESMAESWPMANPAVSDTDMHPAAVTSSVSQPTSAVSRAEVTQPSSADTAHTPEAVPAAAPVSAPLRLNMPLDGSITSGFSGDELIFCSTMCDWRVHNGVDVAGSSGQEVKACAGGIVEGFAADMLYGNTAIIRHEDDSVMYYCGLSDTQMVSDGLQVKAGDVIGYIGEVPSELEEGPHIHLAMIKDGQFIDPAPLIKGQ